MPSAAPEAAAAAGGPKRAAPPGQQLLLHAGSDEVRTPAALVGDAMCELSATPRIGQRKSLQPQVAAEASSSAALRKLKSTARGSGHAEAMAADAGAEDGDMRAPNDAMLPGAQLSMRRRSEATTEPTAQQPPGQQQQHHKHHKQWQRQQPEHQRQDDGAAPAYDDDELLAEMDIAMGDLQAATQLARTASSCPSPGSPLSRRASTASTYASGLGFVPCQGSASGFDSHQASGSTYASGLGFESAGSSGRSRTPGMRSGSSVEGQISGGIGSSYGRNGSSSGALFMHKASVTDATTGDDRRASSTRASSSRRESNSSSRRPGPGASAQQRVLQEYAVQRQRQLQQQREQDAAERARHGSKEGHKKGILGWLKRQTTKLRGSNHRGAGEEEPSLPVRTPPDSSMNSNSGAQFCGHNSSAGGAASGNASVSVRAASASGEHSGAVGVGDGSSAAMNKVYVARRSSAASNSGQQAFSISNNASYEHAAGESTSRSDDGSDSRCSSSSGTAMRSYIPTPPRHGSFTAVEQAAVMEQLQAVGEQLWGGYPSSLPAHVALHGSGGSGSPRHTQQLSSDTNALQPAGGSGAVAGQPPGHSRNGSSDSNEGSFGSYPAAAITPIAASRTSTTALNPNPPASPRPQLLISTSSRPNSAGSPGLPQTPRSRMAASSMAAAAAAGAASAPTGTAGAPAGGLRNGLRVSIAADAGAAAAAPASPSQPRRASLPETSLQQRPSDSATYNSSTPKALSGSFAQNGGPMQAVGYAESGPGAVAIGTGRVQGIGGRLLAPRSGASSCVASARGSLDVHGKVAPWQQQGGSSGLAPEASGALKAFLASQQQPIAIAAGQSAQ